MSNVLETPYYIGGKHSIEGETFAASTNIGNLLLSRTCLLQVEHLDELPLELFTAEPAISEELLTDKLQTVELTGTRDISGRKSRNEALGLIIDMANPLSGVVSGPNVGARIMDSSKKLSNDKWGQARKVLVRDACITVLKLKYERAKIAAIVVRPGNIENAVKMGRVSKPNLDQLKKLAVISQASRLSTAQAIEVSLFSG